MNGVLRSVARAAIPVALVAAAAFAHAGARAAPVASKDQILAEGLFREGQKAADAGDWEIACARFTESERLDPASGTLLNLADCEEQRGRLATSWQLYERVGGLLAPDDRRREYVEKRLGELDPRVPRLVMAVDDTAPETSVWCDGIELEEGAWGVPLPLDPGEHTIEVRAPGHVGSTRIFSVAAGETSHFRLEPGPPIHVDTRARIRAVYGGTVLGVSGVLLVTAAVTGGLALHEAGIVHDECDQDLACSPLGLAAARDGSTFAQASSLTLAFGITTSLAGAFVFISGSLP